MAEAIGISFKRKSVKTDLRMSFNDNDHFVFWWRTIMRQGNILPSRRSKMPLSVRFIRLWREDKKKYISVRSF